MIQEPHQEQFQRTPTPVMPLVQLVILIFGTIILLVIASLIAAGLITVIYGTKTMADAFSFNTGNPQVVSALWMLQIISTTIPLFVAPVLFARFVVFDTKNYLKTTFRFNPLLLVIILIIMLSSSATMELLTNINQKLSLPPSLKSIEDLMRSMEQSAQKATEAMLNMNSLASMLWALFVIGLLTAIAEEFLFRGVLQTIFIKWTKNKHVAIWITAILFSAFHMEFFTFLPRVFLGAIFGYFVAYSGSVWPGVWAHFLNNGSAVLITYLYRQKTITLNPDDQHVFNYGSYAFSLIIILILLYVYRSVALKKAHV